MTRSIRRLPTFDLGLGTEDLSEHVAETVYGLGNGNSRNKRGRKSMDVTIRNLDEEVYRRLKARAAYEGKSVGQTLSEILRPRLMDPHPWPKTRSFFEIMPRTGRPGSEDASQKVDEIVYGIKNEKNDDAAA